MEDLGFFPPEKIAEMKALACQLPAVRGIPLSRFSLSELLQEIRSETGLSISKSTLWRLLKRDAIRPWFHRSWISIKDPHFLEKAGPVLDLYQGYYEGAPLGPKDYLLSADEKSQLQILEREFPCSPPGPGKPIHCESDYKRHGTVAYLAALDIRSGRVFGRVDQTTGIEPFQALVDLVMKQEPYASAQRVFWILDNGPSHHPSTSPARLKQAYPNLIAIHLPIHASWLNQIEIYFSILQRKALTPNDLGTRKQMENRILGFQRRYNQTSSPFKWQFTRSDLEERLRELNAAA